MAKFFSDFTAGGVLNTIGQVFGKKESMNSYSEPMRVGEQSTSSSSYAQKQASNTILYIALGGIGLVMMMFMMKK